MIPGMSHLASAGTSLRRGADKIRLTARYRMLNFGIFGSYFWHFVDYRERYSNEAGLEFLDTTISDSRT